VNTVRRGGDLHLSQREVGVPAGGGRSATIAAARFAKPNPLPGSEIAFGADARLRMFGRPTLTRRFAATLPEGGVETALSAVVNFDASTWVVSLDG
jgi:hypothetical protein